MTPLLQALVALAFATPAAPPADPITWKIDRTHSELSFRIRHLVSRVQGTFREWEGSIVADPADWNAGRTEITIQTASIDTRNEERDTHLRSADFFDVVAHPTISFSSTSVQVAGDKVTLNGTLTIRGVSRPVTLTGEALGMTGEGPGKQRIG
ncbi:MAG: YceI family protein, partial [Gemmatimonadales bacterium]|nr:YceI family protein [Gemmatimonadales bacterium]